MQKYRFELKTQKKMAGIILEISAKLDMVVNNVLYLSPMRASTTFTT